MGGQVKNNFKNNPNFKTDSISRDVTAFDVVVVFEVAFDVAFEVGVAVAFEFPFFFLPENLLQNGSERKFV